MGERDINVTFSKRGRENAAFENDSTDVGVQVSMSPVGTESAVVPSAVEVSSTQETRQQWDRPIEFLLSCISMSVGLGNVWRFPYTAYENGGGAFLIPYLLVLFFLGKPLYFLEMAIGQFSSKGQVKVWKMAPLLKGVGYGSAFGTACVLSYYCSLMALTVFYFVQSFRTVLPWSICNPEWAKHNITCANNLTSAISHSNRSIPELYFKIDVLHELENIDDGIGLPDWRLTLCLLFSWGVILTSLIKGVQSAGKFAYFTALFPYVVLFTLLVHGLTLEGSWDGIWYFIKPQWGKLLEPQVWAAAIAQCFYSLGVGFGSIIMFASYNPFHHNVYRCFNCSISCGDVLKQAILLNSYAMHQLDAMIISYTDTFTSLLAGCTIFGILGNLAHNLKVGIADVAGKGPALAFASYPLAISKFKIVPQIFSALFFLMLFTLGMGSASPLAGGIITIIHDQFPKLQKKWITVVVCIFGFLSGLVYVTPGGQWILDLVDYFGGSFVIYVMATFEIIGIVWIYGLDNVCRDIEFMLGDNVGNRVGFYWRFCWAVIIPIALLVVLIYSLTGIKDGISYDGKPYPTGILFFGWLLAIIAIMLIPIAGIHTLVTRKSEETIDKLIVSILPAEDWGPLESNVRRDWLEHKKKAPKRSFFPLSWMNDMLDSNNEAAGVVPRWI